MGSYISSRGTEENQLLLSECSKFWKATKTSTSCGQKCDSDVDSWNFFASAVRYCNLLIYLYIMQYERWFDFDTNPLYALMHESIYCQVKLFLVGNIWLIFKITGLIYVLQNISCVKYVLIEKNIAMLFFSCMLCLLLSLFYYLIWF